MVDQGPAQVANYRNLSHYRYNGLRFALPNLTFSQILNTFPDSVLNPLIPVAGASLTIPPQTDERIYRVIFRIVCAAYIQNTFSGGLTGVVTKPLFWGNTDFLAPITIDAYQIPRGFIGEKDYVDISGKISRINLPQLVVAFGIDASAFDPSIITPAPGAVHALAAGLNIDVFAYDPKIIPDSL